MSGPVLYVRVHKRHVRIHLPAADVPTLRLGLLHVCEEDDLMQPSRSLKARGYRSVYDEQLTRYSYQCRAIPVEIKSDMALYGKEHHGDAHSRPVVT
jgi:hypothetical protein